MFISTLKKVFTSPVLTKTLLKSKPITKQSYALIQSLRYCYTPDPKRPSTTIEFIQEQPSPSPVQTTKQISMNNYAKAPQSVPFRPSTEGVKSGAATNVKPQPTVDQMIRSDMSLEQFMLKIYKTTGISFASMFGVSSLIVANLTITQPLATTLVLGGLLTGWTGIYAMGYYQPKKIIETLPDGTTVEKIVNPWSRKLAYSSIVAACGVMMAPLIQKAVLINPVVIPIAAGLSILTMAGASLYAMHKPLGAFKYWKAPLYGALFALFSMNMLSLVTYLTIGPTAFTLAWAKVDMYVGLVLFTAFQAYDTHQAVQKYTEGKYDHLEHALEFFLNIRNLFSRYIRLLLEK